MTFPRKKHPNILSVHSLLQVSPSTNGNVSTPTMTLMSHSNGSGNTTNQKTFPSGVSTTRSPPPPNTNPFLLGASLTSFLVPRGSWFDVPDVQLDYRVFHPSRSLAQVLIRLLACPRREQQRGHQWGVPRERR